MTLVAAILIVVRRTCPVKTGGTPLAANEMVVRRHRLSGLAMITSSHRHFALAFSCLPSFGLPRSGASTPRPASPCGDVSHLLPVIHARAPTPRVLQWWLSPPHQQTRRRRCPRPWEVQLSRPEPPLFVRVDTREFDFPRIRVVIHNRASEYEGPRAPGKTGALSSADHAPPPFSRFLPCNIRWLQAFRTRWHVIPNYPPVPQTSLLAIVRISSALRTTRDDAGAFLVLRHGHATTQYKSTQRERVMIRDRRVVAVCHGRLLLTERTVLAAGTAIICARASTCACSGCASQDQHRECS